MGMDYLANAIADAWWWGMLAAFTWYLHQLEQE